MIKQFTVFTEPRGKDRPRFARRGGHILTYPTKKTVEHERQIKLAYKRQCSGYYESGIPLEIEMLFFMKPPKSIPKKRLNKILNGEELPCKKPDVDNQVKAVLDALNGVAYFDDKQVIKISAIKRYAETERIEITIKEITDYGKYKFVADDKVREDTTDTEQS